MPELPVDKEILGELELMEKDCEINDILCYRAIAERETQGMPKDKYNNLKERKQRTEDSQGHLRLVEEVSTSPNPHARCMGSLLNYKHPSLE
ncbi:hypothetical protein QJS04_geneDACA021838 [Acorus gramineus]|uniref:Uncharacterized protein n=1 Tax=Acorus gramineus TaxID=55184 RepID=A0AAV9ADU5_ACOGR|nr:hypothetical protein QJS04_geneDACA021838 [Acorus gramineus]